MQQIPQQTPVTDQNGTDQQERRSVQIPLGRLHDGYSSQSEADMALCSHLAFWTEKDPAQIDRLFRQSGLMRDKWDRPQAGTTYGAITIQKAIDNCKEVYTPKQEHTPQFPPLIPLTPQWSDLPPFPVDALPDVIRRYVSEVAEHSQDSAGYGSCGSALVSWQSACREKYKVEGTPAITSP